MQGKKTFIFYSDWINMVREMPNKDAGELLKHILSYVNDENPKTDNVLVKMAFGHMKPMLKEDLKKWELIREKRKKAGAKGGKANAKQKKANAKQTEAVNDNVNVSKDIIVSKDTKPKFTTYHFKKVLLDLGVDKTHLEDWMKVRKTKKASNTETALRRFINECNENEYPISQAVKNCAENSWSGFKYEWIINKNGNTKQTTNNIVNTLRDFAESD